MSELEQCYRALEIIGKSFVQKSVAYQSPRVAQACAIAKATSTQAGAVLARRILQLERQQSIRKQLGYSDPAPRRAPAQEEDWWSSQFSKADSEEDLLERLKEIAEEKSDIIRQIREKRGMED
jgi:hypothetical protein